jgi:hypothetical protein
MDLSDARKAKEAVLAGSRRPGAFRLGRRRQPTGVAVGITPLKGGDDFLLALRLREETDAALQVVEDAEKACGGQVDVRVTGRIRALNRPVDRPLRVGASVGHERVTAGTLGGFVKCARTGQIGILSNNHVLANENAASPGDAILQPGPIDGGTVTAHRVASLARFVELRGRNTVDAAFAVLDEGVAVEAEPLAVAQVAENFPAVDVAVAKVGRTTGRTVGVVTAFDVDAVDVDFESTTRLFYGCLEVRGTQGAFSEPGDSGSVIFGLEDGVGYALLFAGTEDGDEALTYGNNLAEVLRQLDTQPFFSGGAP